MKRYFNGPLYTLVLAFFVGSSCSESEEPNYRETPITFEHTFHCVPTALGNSAVRYIEIRFVSISAIPEVVALGGKIKKIAINGGSATISNTPDDIEYDATGLILTCPALPNAVNECTSALIDGDDQAIPWIYDEVEFFVGFKKADAKLLRKSLLVSHGIYIGVDFTFFSFDQGYPISEFDVTVKLSATLYSIE